MNLKQMKKCIMQHTATALEDFQHVNTCELTQAIDMIKDLTQAIYYHTIVKSMEQKQEMNIIEMANHLLQLASNATLLQDDKEKLKQIIASISKLLA